MTTEPRVLHVVRPYANVDEYLAAEAWTLDARSMLLLDPPPLETDAAIIFDVTLGDGSRPIKAEARVSGPVPAEDGRPGGVRVRFKRYGAPTKAFIERAMALLATEELGGAPNPSPGAVEPSSPERSAPDVAAPSALEHLVPSPPADAEPPDAPPLAAARPPTKTNPGVAPAPNEPEAPPPGSFRPVPVSPSGRPDVPAALAVLRARASAVPETPSNREYLLEKLRQRGQGDDVTMRYQRDELTVRYQRND